jgi:hypothetical protein
MEGIAEERTRAMEDLVAQGDRMKGILAALQQTIREGNQLMVNADALALRLGLEPDARGGFDINEYKSLLEETSATISQLRALVQIADEFMNSPGLIEHLSQLDRTVERVGEEVEDAIDHTFLYAALLIGLWTVAYVVARYLVHALVAKRSDVNP